MGCTSSKTDQIKEEVILEIIERNLLFCINSSTDIDMIIRKYSYQGTINENQWGMIVKNLNLNYTSSILKQFYSTFSAKGTEGMSLEQLLVLGILNGNDLTATKAKLIFEVFDQCDSKEIEEEVLNHIFEVISICCVRSLKSLVKVVGKVEKEEKIIIFLNQLEEKEEKFRRELIEIIMQSETTCSLQRFVLALRDEIEFDVLVPSGYREALYSFNEWV